MEIPRFTVTELTVSIRTLLENAFPRVIVEGELSNCRPAGSGHLYFTLKDEGAAISGVMFRGSRRNAGFVPADGMLVRVTGRISVYAQRGTYQIIADEMEQAGMGEILALLERRKRLLEAEGLFDEERKRPLPPFPATLGVITSANGAALHDILTIMGRRAPWVRIVVLPCQVQGTEAAEQIAARIHQANAWNLADVLIAGRGGGSLEDLLPFSAENVVRAVARSKIPLISAVGHEIDWALSDFAADLRAPTPSAAAELASEHWFGAARALAGLRESLGREMGRRLERVRSLLAPFSLEDLAFRFHALLQPRFQRFDDAREGVALAMTERLKDTRARFSLAFTALEAVNPLSVMERGFSLVTAADGSVVRTSGQVRPGDQITIRPLAGSFSAEVREIRR